MGQSRRFLNLIVQNHESAARSLRRIDLNRLQLFYPTPPPAAAAPRIRRPSKPAMMETIRLPDPILTFGAHSLRGAGDPCNLACYPFGHQSVLATDQAGRSFLYDFGTRAVAAMPELRRGKLQRCLSLFVPASSPGDDDCGGGGGSLYVMVRELREVERFGMAAGDPSGDFEVVCYGNGRTTSRSKRLPLPPFVLDPFKPNERNPEIRSYAVVSAAGDVAGGGGGGGGGARRIVVSVDGGRGTYALDTASHTWSKIGDWSMPFDGKVEYVPEFKLWFGLSSSSSSGDDGGEELRLAAADLSAMDDDSPSPPRLVAGGGGHGWEEFRRPEEWAEQELEIDAKDVQFVSLGSGRFCIARFFVDYRDNDDSCIDFVVLTGVEVVQRVLDGGEVELEMVAHRSVCHYKSGFDLTYIEQLF